MQSETVQDVVLLEPRWLCSHVLGRLLSAETPKAIHHYRGRYRLDEVQALAPESDVEELLQILDAMDVCARDASNPSMVDIPALIKTSGLSRSWSDDEDEDQGAEQDQDQVEEGAEESEDAPVYGGVRLVPAEHLTAFPCGLFHKLQVNLCRWSHQQKPDEEEVERGEGEEAGGGGGATSDDLDGGGGSDIHLWTNGAKVSRGGAEALVLLVNHGQGLEVRVRGRRAQRHRCRALLDGLLSVADGLLATTLPGLLTARFYLSPRQLRRRQTPVMLYQPKDFARALAQREASLANTMGGYRESFASVLTLDCVDTCQRGALGGQVHVADVPPLARRRLCRMLDPPDALGKDWCLLAMNLGLSELVARLGGNAGGPSPTAVLLQEWSGRPDSTVGALMARLRELGRRDAADFLLKAAPVFKVDAGSTGATTPVVATNGYPPVCNGGTSYNSISSVISR